MVGRHDAAELLALARDGSAAAFASLLHRDRAALQRVALGAADPERALRTAITAAMRAARRRDADAAGVAAAATAAAGAEATRAPRVAEVEPLLPPDWFDRAWVAAAPAWPTGRRPLPRPPRWATVVASGLLLAAVGAGGTWLALSSGGDREVLGSIVASPLDGPSALDERPPAPEPVVEEAPELFGDVEIGELPTYDLTTREPAAPTPRIGPAGP